MRTVDSGVHSGVARVQRGHNQIGIHEIILHVIAPQKGSIGYHRHRLIRPLLECPDQDSDLRIQGGLSPARKGDIVDAGRFGKYAADLVGDLVRRGIRLSL